MIIFQVSDIIYIESERKPLLNKIFFKKSKRQGEITMENIKLTEKSLEVFNYVKENGGRVSVRRAGYWSEPYSSFCER